MNTKRIISSFLHILLLRNNRQQLATGAVALTGFFLTAFCPPTFAVLEEPFWYEMPEAVVYRCETGVRYVDDVMFRDANRAYFQSLRTEKPITSNTHLGPFAIYHDIWSKEIYTFVIPETTDDNLRVLGYLDDDQPPEIIPGPLVLKDAFYIEGSGSRRQEVVVISKTTDVIVLFERMKRANAGGVRVFTIFGSKFTVQFSDWRPYIDMGFCERINSNSE